MTCGYHHHYRKIRRSGLLAGHRPGLQVPDSGVYNVIAKNQVGESRHCFELAVLENCRKSSKARDKYCQHQHRHNRRHCHQHIIIIGNVIIVESCYHHHRCCYHLYLTLVVRPCNIMSLLQTMAEKRVSSAC